MLKKYGEAADVTAMRDAGFQWMLGEYPIEKVRNAFRQYLKTGKEIPTPADIIEILDPSAKPKCGQVYARLLSLSRTGPFSLTTAENEYLKLYEQQKMVGIIA